MNRVVAFVTLALIMTSCSAESQPRGGTISDLLSEEDAETASSARWEIEIWDGPSITGSAEPNHIFIPNARQVLKNIVETCNLGQTWFAQATDGVALLKIENPHLHAAQIGCIRAAERPGLHLRDKRINS